LFVLFLGVLVCGVGGCVGCKFAFSSSCYF